ncbi:replication endonuclease [Shewanella sp. T24-MNA-CIBAN-0130]|uniref:replication endonuclease n=1 Tax=Shewanella sp. T24-MNA-CIBAN-0130 TaxID=3140470 RepID=UPI003332A6F5
MSSFREKIIVKAMSDNDDILSPYLSRIDKVDARFITAKLTPFSNLIKSTILKEAFAKPTPYDRNRHILDTTTKLYKLLPKKLAHMFFCFDDDINNKAKECADYGRRIAIDPSAIDFINVHHNKNDYGCSKNPISKENPEIFGNNPESVTENNRTHPETFWNIPESITAFDRTHPENYGSIPELITASDLTHPEIYGNVPESISEVAMPSSKGAISDLSIAQQKSLYEFLSRYVASFGVSPIEPNNKIQISGCIKRYVDNRWWLKKFRKVITQANEKAALHLNFVNSKRQIYASNITTKNRIAQRLRNEQLLSSSVIINELGQRYTLKEVSDLNVSNPKIRKDELICRARGFEDLAKNEGHEALFITVTCPSKYHRAFSKSGAPNPKWEKLMPDEANACLNHQWQKTRAELKRKNINPYGFRVVEPQHDGTPHWHMLFFIEGEKLEAMQDIIRHYALEVDGDESGAVENRCDFKKIDPSKGSATGYILKYIVKNIDGEGLGEDKFGNDSLLVAQRIDAWASCWCIRQFQQIGGASVSVWRELRRIRTKLFKTDSENDSSVLEQARFAADNSDWQGYTTAMGGVSTKLKDRPIKLHYELNIDEETGECLQSYYDGELISKIKGLWFAGKTIVTRLYQWRIEKV